MMCSDGVKDVAMVAFVKKLFANVRIARMSDGRIVLIRDLGLVKGGRGLRYHERLI